MAHCKNDKLQHAVSVNKQICLNIPAIIVALAHKGRAFQARAAATRKAVNFNQLSMVC